jgi:hypothetical protein
MCLLNCLNIWLYCYNHCRWHDRVYKEKLKEKLENIGFKLFEYYGKLYVESFVLKGDYGKNEEVLLLHQLLNTIKSFQNTLNRASIEELKEYGIYLVNIKGELYLERFNYHELITNVYYIFYDNVQPRMARKIYRRYMDYKKYV